MTLEAARAKALMFARETPGERIDVMGDEAGYYIGTERTRASGAWVGAKLVTSVVFDPEAPEGDPDVVVPAGQALW